MSCAQKQTHWDPSSVTWKNKAKAIKQQTYYMAKCAGY